MSDSENKHDFQKCTTTEKQVTFVLTSCGRIDLLEKTVASFLRFNTYPIERYIIIEDSGKEEIKRELEQKYAGKFEIIFNSPKLGQIRSIDRAYSQVTTPLIFHCEDDWEFYRPGFIEDSISVLTVDPKIIQVWLRSLTDTNGHPVEKETYLTKNAVAYRRLALDYIMQRGAASFHWHGFSFNPGIKRKCDYDKIGNYHRFGEREIEINRNYRKLGYYATILEASAVKHIGWGRHLEIHKSKVARSKDFIRKIISRIRFLNHSKP